jgi:hypothetical protein
VLKIKKSQNNKLYFFGNEDFSKYLWISELFFGAAYVIFLRKVKKMYIDLSDETSRFQYPGKTCVLGYFACIRKEYVLMSDKQQE